MRSAAGPSGEYDSREANTPTARLQGGVGARPHPIGDGNEERDATEGACLIMDQVTISQLRDWPPGKVAAQPIEVLAALADSLAEMKTFVADAEARLNAGLDVRFGDRARQLRAADGKDSGRVRLGDGLFVIVADVPKRIDWDQDKLATVVARIRQSGDDPSEYVRTTYEVSEHAYMAWPSPIRRLFEPARTLKLGKPRYAIEARRETEAA